MSRRKRWRYPAVAQRLREIGCTDSETQTQTRARWLMPWGEAFWVSKAHIDDEDLIAMLDGIKRRAEARRNR